MQHQFVSRILIFCLSILSITLFGQEAKKNVVILYNVVPLTVDILHDGTIETIHGKAEGHLNGYKLEGNKKSFEVVDNIDQIEDVNTNSYTKVDIDYRQVLFQANSALLTKEVINALNDVARIYIQDKKGKIMITPYTLSDYNDRSAKLLKNRLLACAVYLQIKGIPKEAMVINTDFVKQQVDFLLLNFISPSSN